MSWLLGTAASVGLVVAAASIALWVLFERDRPGYHRHKLWLAPVQIVGSLLMASLVIVHMNK